MDLIYRKAIAQDSAQCITLRGQSREHSLSVNQLKEIGVTNESWKQAIIDGSLYGYVCISADNIIGYCFGDSVTGEIIVLVVSPNFENLGLGKRLLSKVVTYFQHQKFKRLYLGCSRNPHSRSYGFYRKLGWVSTGKFDSSQDEILE